MCLHSPLGYQIPDETVRIAQAAFPKGNLYMQMQAQLGMIYSNPQFASLFSSTGQPAEDPARLALILVMQTIEGLSDRPAADAVRARIDWKYALALELSDPGFDASVLSEFRSRLISGHLEMLLLDTLLELLQDQDLLRSGTKQRTDSTHILAAVRLLNRLELLLETMRLALNRLATIAPDWLWPLIQPAWLKRYHLRAESSRLPKEHSKREALASQIGADGFTLLKAIFTPDTPDVVRHEPAVEVLRQVWLQQYYGPDEPPRWRSEQDAPPAGLLIHSPHDIEARYSTKGDFCWVGYKGHYTETCEEQYPNLITDVITTAATVQDDMVLPLIQERLAAKGLQPGEQLVDAGYTNTDNLLHSQNQHGIELIGPMAEDPSWQARAGEGFAKANFTIDWQKQIAHCPMGNESVSWRVKNEGERNESITVRFARADCKACLSREKCTKMAVEPRVLTLASQAAEEAMQKARAAQKTSAFGEQYQTRAGVESLMSQGVRAFGLRKARYIGCAKTHLQHILIAVGINLVRLVHWWREQCHTPARISAFVRLATLE